MSGPDRIWAYEINYPISKVHGEKRWVPWEPKPITLQMREGFFGRKTRQIPQVFHEYIRRDPAVLAALPEVQALILTAEARALDSVTTLHTVIADIRAATVGSKPMLSELAQALVAWRDEAVKAERQTIADACTDRADYLDDAAKWGGSKQYLASLKGGGVELRNMHAAIRTRGEGQP